MLNLTKIEALCLQDFKFNNHHLEILSLMKILSNNRALLTHLAHEFIDRENIMIMGANPKTSYKRLESLTHISTNCFPDNGGSLHECL
jgi:hypothetical protein